MRQIEIFVFPEKMDKFKFLLTGLVFLALFSANPAHAAKPFVAAIITGDLPRYRLAHDAFVNAIRQQGLTEDKVEIYEQRPHPDPISWANSIRKAVGIGADLILTYGAPTTLAAKKEARGVPVVFADVYDPLGLGIVRDMRVPGGDLTGISGQTPLETLVKTFRTIYKVQRIGVLYSSLDAGSLQQTKKLTEIGERSDLILVSRDILRHDDLPLALEFLADKVEALFCTESALLQLQISEVMGFARKHSLPVFSQIPGLGDLGALINLEAEPHEQGSVAADYAYQVLAGQKPGLLPVRTPRQVSLVINMNTAKKLNLKVPFQALSLATRVVH